MRPIQAHPKKMLSTLFLMAGMLAAGPVLAQGVQFEQATSSHGYKATISSLKHAVSGNGMMVMGHINQGNALSMTGMHINAQSFLVGNPKVGKKFFSMSPAAGAVLPARFYVWEQNGKAHVGYFQPSALLSAINGKFSKPGHMMDKKFAMILKQATH